MDKSVNVLYGKKWAVCGDSFSNGDFKNALDTDFIIKEGKYAGKNKSYGYLIGNRNNMEIQHLAINGCTLATPASNDFFNCFTYKDFYKQIDKDVDYITLYFGINDSHHRKHSSEDDGEDKVGIIPFGTIDDTDVSTFCGAWNVLLKYLRENYPFAHIGIIASNGCETPDYYQMEIKMAKKWGIPYINLNGDERTPMMLRSQNPEISDEAKRICIENQAVNPKSNKHPNVKAFEFESVFIESWLRSI